MKVLHVIEAIDDAYGGPAKSVPYLVAGLENEGVEGKIVSVSSGALVKNSVCDKFSLDVTVCPALFSKSLRFSPGLARLLETSAADCDAFHLHNLWTFPAYSSFLSSRKNGIPLVCSVRGNLYPWNLEQSRLKKKIAWALFQGEMLRSASCIHATEVGELSAIRNLGIKSPVAVIPNGVDFAEFDRMPSRADACAALSISSDFRYVLFFSRVHPKKGLEYLLEAFKRLSRSYPGWRLIVAGPVYDQIYLDDLRRKYSFLEPVVSYVGMLTGFERVAAFAASNVFVLPAHTENFGIAIGEAMAAGVPVITTTGTPWSALPKIGAGWWVDLSYETITKSLEEAMTLSDDARGAMGAIASQFIRSHYDWKFVSSQMAQLYSWLKHDAPKPDFVEYF